MRVFLCSFNEFTLAIPMKSVLSIFLFKDKAENKIAYKTESSNIHISLPLLFNSPESRIHHGIVIKNEYYKNDMKENILLSTEIQNENNIPSHIFHPIPKALGVFKFSCFFSGMYFISADRSIITDKNNRELVLLLDPLRLFPEINKEYFHD